MDGFIDNHILDVTHLNEGCALFPWGIGWGHLNAEWADDQQGFLVNLHEVQVQDQAEQREEDGSREHQAVL